MGFHQSHVAAHHTRGTGTECIAYRPLTAFSGRTEHNADIYKRHRADFPGEVRVVPSSRFDCPDVAHHLRRRIPSHED